MKATFAAGSICAALLAGTAGALAEASDRAEAGAPPQLDRPTLHSLGVYWIIRGDDDRNASVRLGYRETAAATWRAGAPLVRVERGAHVMGNHGSRIAVQDGWLFAGSVLGLRPGTSYDLRLTLDEPDRSARGAPATPRMTRQLRAQTRSEPMLTSGMRTRHVVPGSGGGSGTDVDPFRGLEAAQKAARPGDLFLLHAGIYPGHWVVNRSGTPDKPIVWRGERGGSGPVTIDGQGESPERPPHAVEASGTHDVWFEDLAIENALHGVTIHDAVRMVVRRCHIRKVDYGINAARDTKGIAQDHFLADNLIEGPSTWPRTKGIENGRGIQLTGEGHIVCYNRIRGFADAIDTLGSARCAAIDFHNNDLSELTDDGIELDYSERNTRCFYNRLTNVFQGISMQPVYGGPVYVFRNVMDNVAAEPFKLHNSPSGCLIFHNTCVKNGVPALLWTPEPVRNSVTRNNLFVGTAGKYAFESTAPMRDCDFDYDGFAGGPFRLFLSWNRTRYATLAEVRQRAAVFKHALQLDAAGLFASGVMPPQNVADPRSNSLDFRLAPKSAAVDAGAVLPGWNDGFHGKRPDLGAYELGDALPHYGPRMQSERGRG
jgi:hypothetical protein